MTAVHTAGTASQRYLELGRLPSCELEALLVRGRAPDLRNLVGWEYRGRNVAWWAERSPILKFVKGFYREGSGRVMGYNVPIRQDGLAAPWTAKPSNESPKRFGFFQVSAVDAAARDNAYLNSVLLDYSRGGNSRLDPVSRLRDYVVRVDPESDELLLGKAYLAFGPARVATSFFLLERHRASDYRR